MLAKKFRLPIQNWHKAQRSANRKAQSRKSDFFVIKMSGNNSPFSRFGIVISSKVSKSAVKRNKIKRIIFNFIRLNKLHEISGHDILITVLPKTAELEKEEIEKELSRQLNNLAIQQL